MQLLTLTALQHQLPAAARALGLLTVVVPLPRLLAHWLVSALPHGCDASSLVSIASWPATCMHSLAHLPASTPAAVLWDEGAHVQPRPHLPCGCLLCSVPNSTSRCMQGFAHHLPHLPHRLCQVAQQIRRFAVPAAVLQGVTLSYRLRKKRRRRRRQRAQQETLKQGQNDERLPKQSFEPLTHRSSI